MSKRFSNNNKQEFNAGNDINIGNRNNLENKQNNVDKSQKITVNNIHLTPEELKERREREINEKRYGLAAKCGEVVKCIGILTSNITMDNKTHTKRYTIKNVVDKVTSEYLTDHMQLEKDVVDRVIKPEKGELYIIEIYGEVGKYGDGVDRYKVDPSLNPHGYVKLIESDYVNSNYTDYNVTIPFTKELLNKIKLNYSDNQLKNLINYNRNYMNQITSTYNICKDFIYNFIINQYMCNSSHRSLYESELPMSCLATNEYIDLVFLTSYACYILSCSEKGNLVNDFKCIAKAVYDFIQEVEYIASVFDIDSSHVIEVRRFLKKDFSLNTSDEDIVDLSGYLHWAATFIRYQQEYSI